MLKLKKKIYDNKTSIFKKDVAIEKVLVSNKISFGEENYKYFIGYLHNDDKIQSLHTMLPKRSCLCKKL